MHDTVQHKFIEDTLKIFGVPNYWIVWVMKLHTNFEFEIKVGKHKSKLPYGYDLRQGDILAPMLFILVTNLAAEVLAVELKKNNATLLDV